MKKLLVLLVAGVALAFAMTMQTPSAAEKPKGTQYSASYSWDYLLDDSTAAPAPETLSTIAGGASKIFNFSALADYNSLYGYFVIYYDNLDTTTAGAVGDTAKDTVTTNIYTAEYDGAPYKLIYTNKDGIFHSTAANADYVWFNLSDSTLADKVYFEFITKVLDSTGAKVKQAVSIDYTASVRMWAK